MGTDRIKTGSRHFERRDAAARAGIHLPREEDLLLGMSFLAEDPRRDMRAYAERLGNAFRRKRRLGTEALVSALEQAVTQQDGEAALAIEAGLADYERTLDRFTAADERLAGTRLRCCIWLAHFGYPEECAQLAGEAAHRAMADVNLRGEERLALLSRALGWAAHGRRIREIERRYEGVHRKPIGEDADALAYDFALLLERVVREIDERSTTASASREEQGDSGGKTAGASQAETNPVDVRGLNAVVVQAVGNENMKQGRDVAREWKDVIGQPLPLVRVPEARLVQASLNARFPWARRVVETLLADLSHRQTVRLRPTILLGSPGSGKTRFAKELLESLRLPWDIVSCGGLSDSALGGTARRWQSGEPCLPVAVIRRHKCAGPGILLDEVEKASTNRNHGSVADVLIGLIGDETASRFHDPYIEAECDVSHVSWIMTANEVQSLPAPLRDRCRILRFPEPGPENLPLLAQRLLARHYEATGHDPRWAVPLEAFELHALATLWKGGSIRTLERLVERVARSREAERGRQ